MATVNLPSNVEAERCVLGCMLIDPNAALIGIDSLVIEDFSDDEPKNKIIFTAMRQLHDSKKTIDPETVYNQLLSTHKVEEAGDKVYIYTLIQSVLNPENVDDYVYMVKEQSVLRQLLIKCQQIQAEYAKGVTNIGDFINISNDQITQIAQRRSVQGMKSAREIAGIVQDQIETKIQNRRDTGNRSVTGLATGYRQLDEYTHGWQKGDLIILAARPSVGKTAFGLNLAYQAALRNQCPVGFFSLEMSAERIMERLLAACAAVENDKIQTGYVESASDKAKLATALSQISNVDLYFDDTPNSKLGDIIAKATKLKANHPNLGLIVIDYLGRIRYADKVDMANHQQEVSLISGALKSLARQLNIPVICLTQLNRNVEQNDDKRPTLANLRDSGSIEQDADICMLMYRPDYYTATGGSIKAKGQRRGGFGQDQQEQEQQEEPKSQKESTVSETEIIIAKNRNGRVGTIKLMFQKNFSLFMDPSSEFEEREAALQASYEDIGY